MKEYEKVILLNAFDSILNSNIQNPIGQSLFQDDLRIALIILVQCPRQASDEKPARQRNQQADVQLQHPRLADRHQRQQADAEPVLQHGKRNGAIWRQHHGLAALWPNFIECIRLDRQPDLYTERQSGNTGG